MWVVHSLTAVCLLPYCCLQFIVSLLRVSLTLKVLSCVYTKHEAGFRAM